LSAPPAPVTSEASDECQALLAQAQQMMEDSQYEQAWQVLGKALLISRQAAGLHLARSICLEKMGNLAEAREAIRQEMRLRPENHKAKEFYLFLKKRG
jgi:Flp pilus assembly protein TadD